MAPLFAFIFEVNFLFTDRIYKLIEVAHTVNHKEAYHDIAYLIVSTREIKFSTFASFIFHRACFIFHQHEDESNNIGLPYSKVDYYGPLSIYLAIVHKIFRVLVIFLTVLYISFYSFPLAKSN